jgi:hypothetical protein
MTADDWFRAGGTQAILPEHLEEYTVESMMTGESAFTVPWAMWVDRDRRCWLHPGYRVSSQPGGTVRMLVERRDDGYHVFPPFGERYKPSQAPGFVGGDGVEFIPVVGVVPR